MAARRIDDDADIALAFVEGQQLRGDPLGHLHVDFAEDQHGARLEQRLGDRRGLRLGRCGLLFFFVLVFVSAAHGKLQKKG